MNSTVRTEPLRKHRLTRLGFHFVFVGSFAMLGGALRGFNLLLMLAGLMVGALIMQWRWSRRSVEAVSVVRRLPTEAFAGKPFRMRYVLTNHSRWMPVWMMRVVDKVESIDQADSASGICAVGVISAHQTVTPTYDCVVARRGRYRFGPIELMTTFPFALIRSRQIDDASDDLHVFPALLTLRADWRSKLISRSGGMATTGRRSGPSEGDFFGLREWQTGDSPKWIHWRTTARTGEPHVRQFEQQRRFDICLLVDAHDAAAKPNSSAGIRPAPMRLDPASDVETAISLAATLMLQLIDSVTNRVVLAVAAEDCEAVIGAGSIVGKRRMLEVLADIVPGDRPSVVAAANKAMRMVGNTQDLIVVRARSFADAKQSDPAVIEALAPWIRRGAFSWINVAGREVDRWIVRDGSSGERSSPPRETPFSDRSLA